MSKALGEETTQLGPTLKRAPDSGMARADVGRPTTMRFDERYEAIDLLGQGGMGVVSLYDDHQIGRSVAMKVMRGEYRDDRDTERRFLREARVQAQLEHPAIVPVYDMGVSTDGAVFFTMKRVKGTTLHDVLNELRAQTADSSSDRFTRRQLLRALVSVCLAVDFAHRHGVLHRDLKPGNIMLGDFGEVYVLDWGLACLFDEAGSQAKETLRLPVESRATVVGAVMGTPGYMAPEQLMGPRVSVPADVYALGAILFEILTLRPLHDAPTPDAIVAATIEGVDARPSRRAPDTEVAPELEAIVVKATALDPADRYATARDLHNVLERFLDGERDSALRKEMAVLHTEAAERAAQHARDESEHQIEHRREAMREIGRALALDPTSERAVEVMIGLLGVPPTELPPEVRDEVARNDVHKVRWVGRIGGWAYLSLLVYVPMMFWLGVRRPAWVIAYVLAAIGASAMSFYTASRREPRFSGILAVMLLSTLAFSITSAMFGPLLMSPMLLAVNAIGYASYMTSRQRPFALAASCAGVIVPFLLGMLGWLPGGYTFSDAGMLIAPGILSLPPAPTIAFLMIVNIAAVITGTVSVSAARDSLARTELQMFLYTWHLREFVPAAARAGTDPTARRRAALELK